MSNFPKTLNSALIWLARITLAVLVIVSLAPLVNTGYWVVRLCDFPRVQLLFLLLVPTLATVAHAWGACGFRREHWILGGGILAAACWQAAHVLPFTPLWPQELADASEQKNLRLMVANIKYSNTQFDEVSQVIQQQDPDLLLLIEINQKWKSELDPLRQAYPHHVEVIRDEGLGLALWSKLPILNEEVKYLVSKLRPSIFATLALPDGKTVQVAGLHPTPPGLKDDTPGGRRDSRVRDAELVLVAQEVQADADATWLVTGDFNDVAWSHTTRLFKRLSGLGDPRVGRALLTTYHADYPPLRYPIDHVFLSQGSTVGKFQRVRLPGSDHFAVLAEFHVAGNAVPETASSEDEVEAKEIVEEGEQDAQQRNIEADSKDTDGDDR
ncbi:endonuclease/exonuclease/phosphatase family protein [Bremerella volcania]|uniref:endonuclease/exonuclease/phosphatase family protein n=1 Tax=Bremerella volcania TaxID=2527984 RepID=UPI0013FCFA9B|nr:endonuclease/exonuclease/phosphatase family protein [Bremerella volcania]